MPFIKFLTLLFNTVVAAECITFIAAILLLHKKRIGVWRLFIALFALIVLAETAGCFMYDILGKHNHWVYNINMILTDIFIFWILSTANSLQKERKAIYIVIILFFSTAVINLFFFEGLYHYNQYTETAGDIIQIIISCFLFYRLITEVAYRNLFSYEYFWLANGILFSSLGSTILYHFPEAMSSYQKLTHINVFAILNNILNVLLYSSLIIAFICRYRNTR